MMATQTNNDAPNIIGQIPANTVGAEIGVWMGNSSEKMLARDIKELHLVDPYSVEPYKDNSEMPFEQYIAKYQKITGEFSESGFTNYYNQVHKTVKKKFEHDSRVTVHRMTSREFFTQNKDIELAAEDLRMATRHLGSIVGKVDVEEILSSIFKDFCIGK